MAAPKPNPILFKWCSLSFSFAVVFLLTAFGYFATSQSLAHGLRPDHGPTFTWLANEQTGLVSQREPQHPSVTDDRDDLISRQAFCQFLQAAIVCFKKSSASSCYSFPRYSLFNPRAPPQAA